MRKVNIALAQLVCEDGMIERNLWRLDDVVKRYGSSHDIIVFPETYIIGFPPRDVIRALAQPLDGSVVNTRWAAHLL
jgi:(R)-amidase